MAKRIKVNTQDFLFILNVCYNLVYRLLYYHVCISVYRHGRWRFSASGRAMGHQGSVGLDSHAPPQGSGQQPPEEYEQTVAPVYHHHMATSAQRGHYLAGHIGGLHL